MLLFCILYLEKFNFIYVCEKQENNINVDFLSISGGYYLSLTRYLFLKQELIRKNEFL